MKNITEKIMEMYSNLEPEMQSVMLWIIENMDTIDQMCRGEVMSKEKWDKYMKWSREENCYIAIALLICKKIYDDKIRQENCQDEE